MKTFLSNAIRPTILLLTIAVTFIACDKDFVNVESDIRGVQNFNTSSKLFPFKAYNKTVEAVQTNGFPSNLLGVYNDPNYGPTVASVVTQIEPATIVSDFGDNPEIISVKLYVPYFSTLTETDDDGNSTYELDSVFGNLTDDYKLSVYRNNFYLRTLDPESDFDDPQAYYSNTYNSTNTSSFEGDLLYQNDNFLPSTEERKIEEATIEDDTVIEEIEDRRSPGIYIDLTMDDQASIDYWTDIMWDTEGEAKLEITDINEFKNYFRGLIFKAESNTDDGNMLMLNYNGARIDIRYENDVEDSDPIERERDTYTFNFNGIRFNSFENLPSFPVLMDGNETDGDNQLFLKGFEGSMTVIELFNGTILDENGVAQDALEYFRSKEENWLINEANLNFYVDQTTVDQTIVDGKSINEPDRIILYDLENNTPIIDYFFDSTENLTDPVNSRIIHAPRLITDSDGKGVKYKFRITEHLNQMLFRDAENVKLGLYVSGNVNFSGTSDIENTDEDDTVRFVPQTSIIAPKGTVLYGNTTSVPESSKATFEIFYSESQN